MNTSKSIAMEWSRILVKRTAAGIHLKAPEGEVFLSKSPQGIVAQYQSGPLRNGSSLAYAKAIKQAALDYVQSIDLPWSTGPEGQIIVHHQASYYEQTFNEEISVAETLRTWQS